jgi:hypothetical protein
MPLGFWRPCVPVMWSSACLIAKESVLQRPRSLQRRQWCTIRDADDRVKKWLQQPVVAFKALSYTRIDVRWHIRAMSHCADRPAGLQVRPQALECV